MKNNVERITTITRIGTNLPAFQLRYRTNRNSKICIFPIWNQKSSSREDYTRIELLSRRNCSRLKWKSCSIWNGIPDVLRRAISVDPFSKQFEIVFRARDAFTVCVPLCICLRPICYRRRYGTLFDTPIYTKTKENVGASLWRAKTEFRSAVERFQEEEYFLPLSSCWWPSVTTYHKGNRTCSIINSTIVFSCSLWKLLGTIYFWI